MSLREFLARSSATPDFHAAVERFLASGASNEHVEFSAASPPVKVERTLTMLLKRHPELPIERVRIEGSSGCEFFRGVLRVATADAAERTVRFHWDCRWKAQEMGWEDYFGYPDQIRAARELGYDCFKSWSEDDVKVKAVALAGEMDAIGSGEPVPA